MGFTVKQVEKLARDGKPGSYADGDGLYLRIGPTGAASWQFRYSINGKRRAMGLGSLAAVGLAEARQKAAVARIEVQQGTDPLAEKEAEQIAEKARSTTFAEAAADYIKAHRPSWKNAKHAQQWENTLAQYVFPRFGKTPVGEITTADVLRVLKPIWQAKPETASRVRNRIELVIDSARAQGLSDAPNPAAWRGHLDKLLPRRTKASRGHHAAMDYRALPAFFTKLRADRSSLSSIALQLTILTGCRTSEVLQAEWKEFDFDAALWTIPAARMKAGTAHRVPLAHEALGLLAGIKPEAGGGYVFPSRTEGRPLSGMAMLMVLRKIGHPELTVHGFRSTFRDWCAEETHFPNIVAEQALAHTVGDKVEAAYRRGDLLDKRRALMRDWASYCTTKAAENVIPLRSNVA